MTFAWPLLLWLLVVPLALLVWESAHRRRAAAHSNPKILRAEAGPHSLTFSNFTSEISNFTARPRIWLAFGLTFAVLALARPQWGRLEEPVFDQAREIILAIDLSRSMLTPDVKPSRLDRGKLLIQSLLEKLEGERVGLIVFSGTAFLQSPLSADYEILREFLPALNPEFLPEGGTNYRALLDTAISAFGSTGAADRFLIILSDGEATDDDWKSRADELKKKGIRVIGLGIGTGAGAMIPDGTGGFVKDDRGAVVLSKLESGTLRELADTTGGIYQDASAWIDLPALLKQTVETGQKGKFVEKNTVRLVERYQWALAPALLCLLLSFWREFPVRPRPRDIRLTAAKNSPPVLPPVATTTAVLLALFVTCHFSLLTSLAAPITAPDPATPTAPDPAANLGKLVSRLAGTDLARARDWSELSRETVTWGQHLQSAQQPVPEGPVRDALAAVDLGEKLDRTTADWPKLREELEALLRKPDEQKKDDQQKNDQQQKQDQKQSQDQKQNQDQKQDQKQDSPQDQQKQNQDQQKSQDGEKNDPKKNPPEDGKKPESAFGDMKDKPPPPPPPPPGDTQKVGGAPEKKEGKEPLDPSLAMPLQKLEQLRNQDSPAELYQLMRGDPKPDPAKKGKNW